MSTYIIWLTYIAGYENVNVGRIGRSRQARITRSGEKDGEEGRGRRD